MRFCSKLCKNYLLKIQHFIKASYKPFTSFSMFESVQTQLAFTCSKLTIKQYSKMWNMFKVNNSDTRTMLIASNFQLISHIVLVFLLLNRVNTVCAIDLQNFPWGCMCFSRKLDWKIETVLILKCSSFLTLSQQLFWRPLWNLPKFVLRPLIFVSYTNEFEITFCLSTIFQGFLIRITNGMQKKT